MIHMKRLTLILLASSTVPWHLCNAGDGIVTGDTRYKFPQSERVSEKSAENTKVVQPSNARKLHRVAPRRWHVGSHWYYARGAEMPWSPNAPGD
jgi:hypothetical protein